MILKVKKELTFTSASCPFFHGQGLALLVVALRIVFRMVTKKLKLYKIRLKNNLIYLHKKEKEKHAYIYIWSIIIS